MPLPAQSTPEAAPQTRREARLRAQAVAAHPHAGATHTHSRPERAHRSAARRVAATSASAGVIVAVGLLAVGMTMPIGSALSPAAAAAAPIDAISAATGGGDAGIQAYVAHGAQAEPAAVTLNRVDGFAASVTAAATPAPAPSPSATSAGSSASTTVSGATGAAVQQAGTTGITSFSNAVFTNNRACPVQWPFAVGVPISWGFGPRPGEFHEGVDFTPGAGAHIQAIAAGTVVVASSSYYGYGGAVMIDHVIDGQKIASLYGHLEAGSIQVHVGEQVQVGQYIGNTGATGYAFGANTHFEIRENDTTPINPIPWLKAHNQC